MSCKASGAPLVSAMLAEEYDLRREVRLPVLAAVSGFSAVFLGGLAACRSTTRSILLAA